MTNTVIGNNLLVVEAAAAQARALGYAPHVLTRALEGEAREVARTLRRPGPRRSRPAGGPWRRPPA